MAKPTARAVALKAMERLQGPEIAYRDEVCDVFIKRCIQQCGGKLEGSGTNHIFRNHCSLTAAFDGRHPEGLEMGEMLFIRAEVGADTKERYRHDGIGDVYHIGIYVGPIPGYSPEYCVIHSSQRRGKVAASTLQNAWNRRGRLACLDYGTGAGSTPDAPEPAASGQPRPAPGEALVAVTGARMRRHPEVIDGARHNRICTVPQGTLLPILARRNGWTQAAYGIHRGWLRDDLLAFGGVDAPHDPDDENEEE